MITLQKGAVYRSRHNGMVEYTGLDRFWGETTHRFRRITCGGTSYVNLDELDDFLEPQETLESVKQQLDSLIAAISGVADILDELSHEQSVSRLQGGADGAASGIRLSISKILGGAS